MDSHLDLPVVDATRAVLESSDFQTFAALADLPMGMTAHIVFTAIDAAHPATTSRTVINDVIRGHIGFDGLLLSDDLSMEALTGTLAERAAAAMEAGCDIALHCNGKLDEARAVAAASLPLTGRTADRAAHALGLIARPPAAVPADLRAQFQQRVAA